VSVHEHESCFGSWSSNEIEWRDEEEILARILCRLGVLKHAGCDQPGCVLLAGRLDVALERALTLLARGCPPALAIQILA
jgi:hypothetical protein